MCRMYYSYTFPAVLNQSAVSDDLSGFSPELGLLPLLSLYMFFQHPRWSLPEYFISCNMGRTWD